MGHPIRPSFSLVICLTIIATALCAVAAAPANGNSTKALVPAEAIDRSENENVTVDTRTLCESKDTEIDCNQTEYAEYMQCVEQKRTIRKKRQTLCPYATASAAPIPLPAVPLTDDPLPLSQCEFEHQKCVIGCRNDNECADGCAPCLGSESSLTPTNCMGEYNQCVANCLPGQPCETTCKSLCPRATPALGYKTVIFEGHNGGPSERVQVPIGIGHNITTIIRLNNYINNTNTINVPTNINNTNINTVNLYQNTSSQTGGLYGLGQTKDGSCCFAVRPKSCRTSTSGLRCHHRRHKTCGAQCTSRIIHAQTQKSCNQRGKCNTQVSYVPEPSPKCHYASQWPFVSCGSARMQKQCGGCYDHYGANYPVDPRSLERCLPCYDDGYDVGPKYRQGPFYRPNYYHQPPCYVTGTCYSMGGGYGYGYYPPPPPPPFYGQSAPYPMPGYPPMSPPEEEIPDDRYPGEDMYPGEEEFSGYEPIEDSNKFNEEEWEQVIQKCKLINVDDSTVIIKNCTAADLSDNPYAASRVQDNGDNDNKQRAGPNASEDDMEVEMSPQAYNPYDYNPYSYYAYPPPPPPPQYPFAGYYSQPYGYYNPQYYPRTGAKRQQKAGRGEVIRPYYYDNYGDDGEDSERNVNVDAGEGDDFWKHDEEKELIEKGFVKVEEM